MWKVAPALTATTNSSGIWLKKPVMSAMKAARPATNVMNTLARNAPKTEKRIPQIHSAIAEKRTMKRTTCVSPVNLDAAGATIKNARIAPVSRTLTVFAPAAQERYGTLSLSNACQCPAMKTANSGNTMTRAMKNASVVTLTAGIVSEKEKTCAYPAQMGSPLPLIQPETMWERVKGALTISPYTSTNS